MTHFSSIRRSLADVGRKTLAIVSATALALQMVMMAIPPQAAQATFTVAPASVGAAYDELSTAVGIAVPAPSPISTTVAPSDFGSEIGLDVTGDVEHVGSSLRLKTAAVVPGLVTGAAVTPVITKPTSASWTNFQFNYNNVAAAGSSVEMQVWDALNPGAALFSTGPQVALGVNTYVSALPISDTVDSIVLRFVFVRAVDTDASPRLTLYRVNWNQAVTTGAYIQQSLTVTLDPVNSIGDQIPAVLPAGTGQNTNLFYLWNFDTTNPLDLSACSANAAHASFTHTYPAATQYTARLYVFSGDNTCTDPNVMNYVDTLVSVGQYDLALDKTVNTSNGPLVSILPGDILNVSLSFINNGPGDALKVVLSDVLPGTMQFNGNMVCASPSAVISTPAIGTNGTVQVGYDTVPNGMKEECTFDVLIPDPTLDLTTYNNTATIEAIGWNDSVAPLDSNQASNNDSVSLTVNIPTLVVSKDLVLVNGNPAGIINYAEPGDVLTYEITVLNPGSGSASNVEYADNLPMRASLNTVDYIPGSSISSCGGTAEPTLLANLLRWNYNEVIFGGFSCTLRYSVEVNSEIDQASIYVNTGAARGEWYDGTPIPVDGNGAGYFDTDGLTLAANDTDPDDLSQAAFIAKEPALVTTKTTSGCTGLYAPKCAFGDVVTYTVTISNVGDGIASNVYFSDAANCDTTYIDGSTLITYPDASTWGTGIGQDGFNTACWFGGSDAGITWLSAPGATLSQGETVTLVFSSIVSNSGLTNGQLVDNTAGVARFVGSEPLDGYGSIVPADNCADVPADCESIPGVNSPGDADDLSSATFEYVGPTIQTEKAIVDVDGAGPSKTPEIGSIITYAVTHTNTGGATAYDLYFFENFDSGSGKIGSTPADDVLCGSGYVSVDITGAFTTSDICSGTPTSTPSWTGLGVDLTPTQSVTLTYQAKVALPPTTNALWYAGDSFTNIATTDYCLDSKCSASLSTGTGLATLYIGPTLDVYKWSNDTYVEATGTYTYYVQLFNFGWGDAYNVRVSDVLPAGLTYVSGSAAYDLTCDMVTDGALADPSPDFVLPVNLPSSLISGTICLSYDVKVGTPLTVTNDMALTNTASVSGEYIDGSAILQDWAFGFTWDSTVTARVPDLAVVKTVDTSACVADPVCSPGETVTWTVDVSNEISAAATLIGDAYNVEVDDTLPAGFTYVPGSTTGCTTDNPTISGSVLTWSAASLGNIAPGGSCMITFDTTVQTSVDAVNNPYVNTAAASGFYADLVTPIADYGLVANDTEAVNVGVFKPVISMTADKTTVNPGDIVTFTITATNQGNIAGTGVEVVFQQPSIMTVLNTATCTSCDAAIWYASAHFPIGVMSAGETVTMTVQGRVNDNAPAGNFLATATLTSDGGTTASTTTASTLYDDWMLVSTGSSTLLLLGFAAGLTVLVRRKKLRA